MKTNHASFVRFARTAVLLASFALGPGVSSVRALVTYTTVADTPEYSEGVSAFEVHAGYKITSSAPAPLDLDFSTLGDETFRLEWLAPAGMRFELTLPEGSVWDAGDFNQLLGNTAQTEAPGGFSTLLSGVPSVTLLDWNGAGLSGASTNASYSLGHDTDRETVGVTAGYEQLERGVVITFSGIRAEFAVPASFDGHLTLSDLDTALYVNLYGGAPDAGYTSPEGFLQLAPIPEPSTAAFALAFVAAGLATRRRR